MSWLSACGRRLLTAFLTVCFLLLPGTAAADTFGIGAAQAPPRYQSTAAGSIDARTGVFTMSAIDLSVGSGDFPSRIDVARFYNSKDNLQLTEFGNGGRVSLRNYIKCLNCPHFVPTTPPYYTAEPWINVEVVVGNGIYRFDFVSGVYENAYRDGSIFRQLTSSRFEFVARDGTSTIFDAADQFVCGAAYIYPGMSGQKNCYYARYQEFPDGQFLNYTYQLVREFQGKVVQSRLREVVNSRGYGVRLYYVNENTGAGYDRRKTLISKIEAFRQSCTTVSGVVDCSTGTLGESSYTYVELTHSGGSKYWSLATSTDMRGKVTTYGYDTDLRMTWAKYPANPTVKAFENTYTGGKVTQQLDAVSQATTYAYGTVVSGFTETEVSDPLGNTTTYKFPESKLQPVSIEDATLRTTAYEYDDYGRVTKVTRPDLGATTTTYDVRGNVTETRVKAVPGTPTLPDLVSAAIFAATCDDTNRRICNQPTQTVAPNGGTTDIQYDAAHGGPTVSLSPANAAGLRSVTRWNYSDFAPAPSTDPPAVSGFPDISLPTIRLATSVDGCLTSIAEVTFAYVCTEGNRVRTSQIFTASTLPSSRTSYELESTTVDPGGLALTTSYTYDKVGNRLTEDGPRSDGDITTYEFDVGRLVTKVISPTVSSVTPQTTYGYDDNSRQTSVSRKFGLTQQTDSVEYNVLGQRWRSIGADGSVITYTFDAAGRPQDTWQIVDSVERRSRVVPDAAGRMLIQKSGVGGALAQDTATYTYDSEGRKTTETDAKGNVTTYCYDRFDRLAESRYPSTATPGISSSCTAVPVGSMPGGSDYEAWFYKANGDLDYTRRRDGQTIAFQFDLLGRLTQRTPPSGNDTVTYTYDLLGRRTAATVVGASARSLGWTYDKAGRVTAAAQGPRTLAYAYESGLTWMEIIWPDAVTVRYASDALSRTTTIAEVGAPTLATYSYDELSRRTGIAWGNSTATSYEYNASTFRLSALSHILGGISADVRWDLTFNSASELRTRERNNDAYAWTNNVNQTLAYQANGLNQYTQAGARLPRYDARGNLISSWASSFGYDIDNRLTHAAGLATVQLAYDAAGRISRNSTNGAVVDHLYDGNDLVAEYDAAGNLLRRHIHGPGVDEPIVTIEGGRRWLYGDPQGSIVAVADASGVPLTVIGYGPYGEPGLTSAGRFGFAGAAKIEGTALYDLRARAYWPSLGRFIQADPIGTDGGMNLYEYAASDPVNMSDPSGTGPIYGPAVPYSASSLGDQYRLSLPTDMIVVTGRRLVTAARFASALSIVAYAFMPSPLNQGEAAALQRIRALHMANQKAGGIAPPHPMQDASQSTPGDPNQGPDDDEQCHEHHCIPRQVLKQLAPEVRRAVQGRVGDRNIILMPIRKHVGSGSIHSSGYNAAWTKEASRYGELSKLTEGQVRQIDAIIRMKYRLPPR